MVKLTKARPCRQAGMAELVYAADLKSVTPKGVCGFDSHSRHRVSAETKVLSAMPSEVTEYVFILPAHL